LAEITFQINLYETTNVVEIVYLSTPAATTSSAVVVGLSGATTSDFNTRTGSSWSATTAGASNASTVTFSSTVKPAAGLTFTWTPPPACVAPVDQASGVTVTPLTATTASGSFTPAASNPSGYVVVRRTNNATPPTLVNGTTYVVGNSTALGGYVESVGASTTWTSSNLFGGDTYYWFVIPYNNTGCFGGPLYNNTSPASTSITTTGCAGGYTGGYTVGATGFFGSITAAKDSLVLHGVTGAVVLSLQSDYTSALEPAFPIVLPIVPCGNNNITIRPAVTGLSVTSANATATFHIQGGQYWIIDGRVGGSGTTPDLVVANTSTTGNAIRFTNDAQYNTVKYCDVQGVANLLWCWRYHRKRLQHHQQQQHP
jgi:hypothetical protein